MNPHETLPTLLPDHLGFIASAHRDGLGRSCYESPDAVEAVNWLLSQGYTYGDITLYIARRDAGLVNKSHEREAK